MRPPSPPNFAKSIIDPIPIEERDINHSNLSQNYVEISPGVRSSPWRDDIQKKKERELKERLRLEQEERIRQET